MGTRGTWGFRVDGVDKVSYNQFDSYPSGLGMDLVQELEAHIAKYGVESLPDLARELIQVDVHETPSPEDFDKYDWAADYSVNNGNRDWYCLLRKVQGEPKWYLQGAVKHLAGNTNFLSESLFCEWAYIINVDEGVLEVYKGFNRNPDAPGRYAKAKSDDGYVGVALVATYPFEDMHRLGKLEDELDDSD